MQTLPPGGPLLWSCLFSIAKAHASRHPLLHADADDCALSFAYRMVVYLESPGRLPAACHSCAWAHRCASNFAKNFLRARARLQSREMSCDLLEAGRRRLGLRPSSPGEPPVESRLFIAELRARLMNAVAHLDPQQRDLFIRRYAEEEPVEALASSRSISPNAVRKSLGRARQRVREALKRQNVSEADLRDYLAACAPQAGSNSASALSVL